MRRGWISKATIVELEKRISLSEKKKTELIIYLQNLNQKYLKKDISYAKYIELTHKKVDERTIKQWIDYYDEYIKECEQLLKKQKKNIIKNRTQTFIFLFVFVFMLITAAYYIDSRFTGFIVDQIEEPSEPEEIPSEPEPEPEIPEEIPIDIQPEIKEEVPSEEDLTPSQEEEPSQELEINITEPVEEILENITEPEINVTIPEENITTNITIPEENITEPNITITENITEEIQEIPSEEIPLEVNITIPEIPKTNITIPEINITGINITEIENASVTTTQLQAVLGQPVKWIKKISLDEPKPIKIKLPKDAKNITIKKLTKIPSEEKPAQEITPSAETPITGETTSENLTELEKLEKIKKKIEELQKELQEIGEELGGVVEVIEEVEKQTKKQDITSRSIITGSVISTVGETQEKQGNFISRFFKRIFSALTGRVILTEEQPEAIEVTIDENATEYEIEYETPAPYALETDLPRGKRVKIIGPEDIHYENVLVFTDLNENLNIRNPSKIRIHWVEQDTYLPIQNLQDKDNNRIYDYIEWIAPQLSDQTFNIIVITKTEHLDSNRDFINDIYEQVRELDNVWSETINNNEYVRVTFETNLTSDRDITIYPRVTLGNPTIQVYEFNQTTLIAEFTNINSNQYNKVYLTNLISESQDVFDLKILNGDIQLDHIIDPQIFFEDWEAGNFNNWDNADWTIVTDRKIGTNSAKCVTSANCEMNTSASIDTSSATEVNVSFSYNDDDMDSSQSGDGIWYWKNSSGDWVNMGKIDAASLDGSDDTWENYSLASTDSQYFHAGFSIRFWADPDTGGGAGNENYWIENINVSITVGDTTPPDLSITFPSNNTNTTDTLLDVNYTASDAGDGLDTCWYSNDTYISNTTLTDCSTNITDVTWTEGQHNVTVWSNDTGNYVNRTEIRFTVDSIPPVLTIAFPSNNTNTTDTKLDINYTASDAVMGLDTCWYSNDTYDDNTTIACGTNITTLTWTEGYHNVTVWSNDSLNNINWTTIAFTIDTTNPGLTIAFPPNNTNTSDTKLDINYTASDSGSGLDTCWYSNDTYDDNTTITCGTNITTLNWPEGYHNVTVWSNDSANNLNWTTVAFTIDSAPPSISIAFPSNNTNTTDTKLDINYTASDAVMGLDTCWYSNDTYDDNTTIACGTNITTLTWTEGYHNVTVWSNDSLNNLNWTTVAFTIDTTNPGLTIAFPPNNTNTSDTKLDINYTAVDSGSGLDTCWYSNDTYDDNTTIACGTNITTLTWTEGYHNVTVWSNDSLNNLNWTTIAFTIDITNPSLTIAFPPNNTNTTDTKLDINYTASDAGVGLDTCWYSNDTYDDNTTIACGTNITTLTWTEGYHNVTVWSNDSANNLNWTTIAFTIDTTNPDLNITFPNNNSNSGDVKLDINYTVSDSGSGLDTCWYSNDTYISNTTLTDCSTNITDVTWTEQQHNITIWANDSVGNKNKTTIGFTISLDTPPEITHVFNESMTDVSTALNEGPNPTFIIINFTVYDANGVSDINASTALINFTQAGTTRQNTSCAARDWSGNEANFTCNVTMWWWDGTGTWDIAAYIQDNSSNIDTNTSTNFQVGSTTSFEISPGNLSWLGLMPGTVNQTPTNHPVLLNNTGNTPIGVSDTGNISINATNLRGEITDTLALWAGNFSVSWATGSNAECNYESTATKMSAGVFTNITAANLTKGNYTKNNGNEGQEKLYFCINIIGSDLSNQAYSTINESTWTIRILLVAVSFRRRKRRKLARNTKSIIGEISIPATIFTEKLGALEAVTKYLKENLRMSYKEIAQLLNRDERTIWTSYNKSIEKQKEILKIGKARVFIPTSIFENRKLTILKATIVYLKEKGLKYSEIAELLNRDQRNIWTIYSRIKEKMKK